MVLRPCYGLDMRRSIFLVLLAVLALTLPACSTGPGEYPSLARRPAERLNAPAPDPGPMPPPVAAAPDPVLLGRIAALETQARTAHERFLARTGAARKLALAATGAPVASEAWSAATIALSELEAVRSEAMIALADVDGLHARAVVDGTDSRAIAEAREAILALIGEEDRVLGELQTRLNQ